MLTITIPAREFYDEAEEMFVNTSEYVLSLEHSLLSISKWESKWHKPFLAKNKDDVRTNEEMMDYIKCMTLNRNVPEMVYDALTPQNLIEINNYINDPMTATTIKGGFNRGTGRNEIITSEVIYYWMVAFQIPFECEKWHINRLLMLVKVCNAMNNPKKNTRPDLAARQKLNQARRAAAHSKG